MKRMQKSQSKGDQPARGPFHVLLVLMAALLLTIALLVARNACERFDTRRGTAPPADRNAEEATTARQGTAGEARVKYRTRQSLVTARHSNMPMVTSRS